MRRRRPVAASELQRGDAQICRGSQQHVEGKIRQTVRHKTNTHGLWCLQPNGATRVSGCQCRISQQKCAQSVLAVGPYRSPAKCHVDKSSQFSAVGERVSFKEEWLHRIRQEAGPGRQLDRGRQELTDPAKCGPVTLALCQDTQAEAIEWPASFFTEHLWRPRRPPPDQHQLAEAVSLLRAARAPLIVAGGGEL